MYIESITIENLRSISKICWDLGERRPEGWHVILGDNGSGKTSFLRGASLALLGSKDANFIVGDWSTYIRHGQNVSTCSVTIRRDRHYDVFAEGYVGRTKTPYASSLKLKRNSNGATEADDDEPDPKALGVVDKDWNFLSNHRSYLLRGWFSAGYGPFRRFTGGDREEERDLLSRPAAGRFMSSFKESVSLFEPITWLRSLYTEILDTNKPSELLQDIIEFINQDNFLPHGVRFDRVTSKDVLFTDEEGAIVRIEDLSDGYRSILCMTLELVRQLSLAYNESDIFHKGSIITVGVPGVVLIDEIDVHLHPSWQRTVGLWYRKHFPKIQFIVTTHSPLVCQAAEHGTVFSLGSPDSDEQSKFVEGANLLRLLYGDILDAYSTELFGTGVERSPRAQYLTQRLAELNILELDRDLTDSEKNEQIDLRRALPTSTYTLTS